MSTAQERARRDEEIAQAVLGGATVQAAAARFALSPSRVSVIVHSVCNHRNRVAFRLTRARYSRVPGRSIEMHRLERLRKIRHEFFPCFGEPTCEPA